MSRVGNRILSVPTGVTVSVDGNTVSVKGPKGELSTVINENIKVEITETEVTVTRKNDNYKSFHGTANANIQNMIIGVTEGYEKKLECVGVGYRFQLKGNGLVVTAGHSHPWNPEVPVGITIDVPSNTELVIKGIDKQLVGEFAANIRKIRPPEPYKGKGIRYSDEQVQRKEGKKASK
jgi:ribosomal protein L6, bacterial type